MLAAGLTNGLGERPQGNRLAAGQGSGAGCRMVEVDVRGQPEHVSCRSTGAHLHYHWALTLWAPVGGTQRGDLARPMAGPQRLPSSRLQEYKGSAAARTRPFVRKVATGIGRERSSLRRPETGAGNFRQNAGHRHPRRTGRCGRPDPVPVSGSTVSRARQCQRTSRCAASRAARLSPASISSSREPENANLRADRGGSQPGASRRRVRALEGRRR